MNLVKNTRLILYPGDIMNIFDHINTYGGAWYRYNVTRKLLGKKKGQYILIKEFAEFEGIPEQDIRERIQ